MKTRNELANDYHNRLPEGPFQKSFVHGAFVDGYDAGYRAAKPQWISVKDRLPEINEHGYSEDVLLLSQVGRMEVSNIEKVKRLVKWRGVESVIETENGTPIEYFTHWMPLPEAPKGEG